MSNRITSPDIIYDWVRGPLSIGQRLLNRQMTKDRLLYCGLYEIGKYRSRGQAMQIQVDTFYQ